MVTKDGHIVAMEFCRTEQLDDGSWTIDDEQTVKLKANFVISAFGSQLGQSDGTKYHFVVLIDNYVYVFPYQLPRQWLQ